MAEFWPKRYHGMPRILYPASVLQPEKMPIDFKFLTCRVGCSSVQPVFFISTGVALKSMLPMHVPSQSPFVTLSCRFLVSLRGMPCVWFSCVSMCILDPLQDFKASQDNDHGDGMIIELFCKMSANIFVPSDGAESCKLHWLLVTSEVSSQLCDGNGWSRLGQNGLHHTRVLALYHLYQL